MATEATVIPRYNSDACRGRKPIADECPVGRAGRQPLAEGVERWIRGRTTWSTERVRTQR